MLPSDGLCVTFAHIFYYKDLDRAQQASLLTHQSMLTKNVPNSSMTYQQIALFVLIK